mmetsp:Transcript_7792/g.16781  ORF Transcript_7792/g.16781 Transcript_7792/m.16781 type:complete len:185 (-) Transcript_7792:150-704(-)
MITCPPSTMSQGGADAVAPEAPAGAPEQKSAEDYFADRLLRQLDEDYQRTLQAGEEAEARRQASAEGYGAFQEEDSSSGGEEPEVGYTSIGAAEDDVEAWDNADWGDFCVADGPAPAPVCEGWADEAFAAEEAAKPPAIAPMTADEAASIKAAMADIRPTVPFWARNMSDQDWEGRLRAMAKNL